MTEETTAVPEHKFSLHEAVQTKIKAGNSLILERAAELIAEETLAKRVKIICDAHTAINKEEGEHRKLHPDNVTFDHNGVTTKVYSKDRWEQRKKLEEKIAKLKKTLEQALDDPSKFGDLANLVTQK